MYAQSGRYVHTSPVQVSSDEDRMGGRAGVGWRQAKEKGRIPWKVGLRLGRLKREGRDP